MRPRREYSVAVVIGLLAMGLAMFGAGAALFLAPPPGYAPPPTPTPTAIVTPTQQPSPSAPQISETPAPSETETPSDTPDATPTAEVTPTPEPTAQETPSDVFAARRAALPDCPDRDDCGIHTAKAGDWLSRLANYYGVSLDEITALNPEIEDPNRIRVGQKIRIPR